MTRSYACDRCKRRKVRCNGQDPCSQCSRGNSLCERRTALRRPGPRVVKRPRDESEGTVISPRLARAATEASERSAYHHVTRPLPSHSPTFSPTISRTFSPSIPASSPESIITPDNVVWSEFLRVRSHLNARFDALPETSSASIEDVAHGCVNLFFQFLFPNTPIAHEPTLRDSITLLATDDAASPTEARAISTSLTITTVRRFTLVTALCAHIISVVPTSLSRLPKALSVVFFDASRAMLRAYEAYDLEHPDVTSLTIRMWHSSCAQNTTGKVGASWHYHTEACCLAQRLRLYDESAIAEVASRAADCALEARLLRANFWHLYLAEKTQVAFRTRAPIIDERICYGGITLLEHRDGDDTEVERVPLLDTQEPHNQANLEKRIFVGFHLRRRMSAMAAALIDDVASCGCRRGEARANPATLSPVDADPEVTALVERYLLFSALINDVPSWVMHPDRDKNPLISTIDDNDRSKAPKPVQAYHTTCFWAQNSNLSSIFHCMRLLILQACIDHGLPVVVGLGDSTPLAWASRKLEIVRDLLHSLQATPFVCLEAQGETAVDKVRRVGTILLELLHRSDNATIKSQADTLFKSLLDILSRLDSKACEGL